MHTRDLTPFCAVTDVAERWPDWTFRVARLPEGVDEVLVPGRKLIVVDPGDDLQWAVAHAAAHLALGHTVGGVSFSTRECADADGWARLWLDG